MGNSVFPSFWESEPEASPEGDYRVNVKNIDTSEKIRNVKKLMKNLCWKQKKKTMGKVMEI